MGERFLHTEEAISSILITPTNIDAFLAQLAEQLICNQ